MSQDEPRVPDPSPETSEARSKWAGPQLVAEVDKDDPDLASTTGDASSKRDTDSLLDIRMKLANVSSKGQSSQEIPAGQRIQVCRSILFLKVQKPMAMYIRLFSAFSTSYQVGAV